MTWEYSLAHYAKRLVHDQPPVGLTTITTWSVRQADERCLIASNSRDRRQNSRIPALMRYLIQHRYWIGTIGQTAWVGILCFPFERLAGVLQTFGRTSVNENPRRR